MRDSKVSEGGFVAAVVLSLLGTMGHFLTEGKFFHRYDSLWLVLFVGSFLTLSGAVVDFDLRRWKC